MKKYKFRSESARINFCFEYLFARIDKIRADKLVCISAFEMECREMKAIAFTQLKRKLDQQVKFANAICLNDDNSDFDLRFMELINLLVSKKYFRLGGQFDEKLYIYKIKKRLEI